MGKKLKVLFITYDNESNTNPVPLGMLYIASYIRKHGFDDITFYSQDVFHYPEEHLTEYLNNNFFNVIGIGFVAGYWQHKKILKICEAIQKSKSRALIVLGGQGASPIPEFYLRKTGAHVVISGEGEKPFLEILNRLNNSVEIEETKGISYLDFRGNCITNPPQTPVQNLTVIPPPAFDLVPVEYYLNEKIGAYLINSTDRYLAMITGRGCPYNCNFCLNLEPGIRLRPMEDVVEEIKKYQKDYNLSYIAFWDELFMLSEKRVAEFHELIMKDNIKIRYWCTGRFNIVNSNILKMLKETGCQIIDYGIEQFDNFALQKMNKKLTEEQIIKGIELTQKHDITIAFNIIFGNTGDTRESLKKSLALLDKYNDFGQLRVIRPVTPYPGTALYKEALDRGLLTGPEDFYNKHINVELPTCNFTNIPDSEFINLLDDANTNIIKKYYNHLCETTLEQFKEVYSGRDSAFRGGRH